MEIRLQPHHRIFFYANLGYTDARIGATNERLPLVPNFTATTGLKVTLDHGFELATTSRHVSERHDGNDLPNFAFAKLPSYNLVDLRLDWRGKRVHAFAGVNNLTDEVYSTLGFSETYYPMPGRNYFTGVSYAF